MSKKLCLSQPIVALTGNYKAFDEDGHKTTLRFREFTASGKKIFGIGQPKRNLTIKPYTEGENSQHARFKAAAQLCAMIREDMALKSQWVARFRADKEKTAETFNGYLLQQAMWGHISEEGAYQN